MMDADDDLGVVLETVDALFCSVADGTAGSTGMEAIWTLFEEGYLKLAGTDDNLGIVPCHSDDERRTAAEQNKPLADYRRRVIEEAVASAACSPSAASP
jgi:hypothetical protein